VGSRIGIKFLRAGKNTTFTQWEPFNRPKKKPTGNTWRRRYAGSPSTWREVDNLMGNRKTIKKRSLVGK
jgi:hypothetical protein